jgi:hypothetical protein
MTIAITLSNVGNLQDTTTAQTTINNNSAAITTAFGSALNTSGDTMLGTINMNGNQIINLPTPTTVDAPARLIDVTTNPTITVPPTGTSGATVPFLNGNNTWSGTNTFTDGVAVSGGTSTLAVSTLSATSTITPSQTAGIVGTTAVNNANAGSVGEYITSGQVSGVSLTSGTLANITSISLTAGDWEVSGVIGCTPAGTTVLTALVGAISLTTASSTPVEAGNSITIQGTMGTGDSSYQVAMPHCRVSISATTTIFLNVQCNFSVSTCTGQGIIRARRVR